MLNVKRTTTRSQPNPVTLKLSGKIALIPGGSKGIGNLIAMALAADDVAVALVSSRASLVQDHGGMLRSV
jgi:NAD(P)-dependent dehydrogenase (short-subunit alcohol dehydrogenase family)